MAYTTYQVIRTQLVSLTDAKSGTAYPFTIVDTPGQEIFYRMRNYGTESFSHASLLRNNNAAMQLQFLLMCAGASVADVVVLVVAADDGVRGESVA